MLHHFTIGFQKPGICADSWFLESNGKMVQLGFSLIKNRAPRSIYPSIYMCVYIFTYIDIYRYICVVICVCLP